MDKLVNVIALPAGKNVTAVYDNEDGTLYRGDVLFLGLFEPENEEDNRKYGLMPQYIYIGREGCMDACDTESNFLGYEWNNEKQDWSEDVENRKKWKEEKNGKINR